MPLAKRLRSHGVATRAVGAGGIQVSPAFIMTDEQVDELASACRQPSPPNARGQSWAERSRLGGQWSTARHRRATSDPSRATSDPSRLEENSLARSSRLAILAS